MKFVFPAVILAALAMMGASYQPANSLAADGEAPAPTRRRVVKKQPAINDVPLLVSRVEMDADRENDAPPPPPEPEYVLPAMAWSIAACESGQRLHNGTATPGTYSLTLKNPNSTASGKYQFLNSTWEWVTNLPGPASAYDERTQDLAFLKLYDNGNGLFHWNPSRSCWSRM